MTYRKKENKMMVTIIGSTGSMGFGITRNLAKAGHEKLYATINKGEL